jgi:DNA-binding LytR/AlgR family response regulator
MKIKCLLVDDEPLAIQLIQNHLAQMEGFEVAGICSNAVQAMEVLRTTRIDLLFLDIKMPKLNGISFLRALQHPPAVIITTAYREYAVEGYELELVDYLLKPITFERFFKAIDRYLRIKTPIFPSTTSTANTDAVFQVRSNGKIHRVRVNEITYVESIKDYITLHLTDKEITAKYKLGDFEKELSGHPFLRIHRSFIVNLNKITAYTANDIEMDKTELPIGASYKEYVAKALAQSMNDRMR